MKSFLTILVLLLLSLLQFSCVTSDKGFDRATIEKNDEFERVVKIEQIEEPTQMLKPQSTEEEKKPAPKDTGKTGSVEKKADKKKDIPKPLTKETRNKTTENQDKKVFKKKQPRQPLIEDDEGFDGRRPIVEPYEIGEEITLGISYFAVEAGKFTMKVMPMVQVNGKKSYHFKYIMKSSPLFSMFYRVNDVAETFVDYQTLVPYSYEIHVDESKQVRETKTFFDQEKMKATMWDRKQKKGGDLEKRKLEWDLEPFPQNVFSAAYYLRNFTLKVGKELKVHVGHEGKNILMTAEVLRRETIFTKAGKFDTFVVKPKFDVEGKFKPTGENYLWLTADDKKIIVRLESKIRIGSIVGEVQKIKK